MPEPAPLGQLQERVGKGMAWLTEHDPTGSFHFWFQSGLTGMSPMPAQAPERREDWRAYYQQRQLWERLFAEMTRREKAGEGSSGEVKAE